MPLRISLSPRTAAPRSAKGGSFPHFTSRPHWGLKSLIEGDVSQLRYIELANVQHFAAEPGYDTRFIRFTVYQLRASRRYTPT